MKFTKEQLKTLSTWEEAFRIAVKAQWARNPGVMALTMIWDIYTKVTGDRRTLNVNCNHCILSLLTDCGKLYFADKAELEKSIPSSKEVKVSQEAKQVVKKAKIKTKK